MLPSATVVLDVGKTLTKLSLFSRDGELLAKRQRENRQILFEGRRYLDSDGITEWVTETLREFQTLQAPEAIVPVGHGAAAAIVRDGKLVCPVIDYEDTIEQSVCADYDAQRDAFAMTGSPKLPMGLNLGRQLYRLERDTPGIWRGCPAIIPWPQFWAWKLSGVAACEVSSLGCHTDLWWPAHGRQSELARRRGWTEHLPPLRRAGAVLGNLKPKLANQTGLSKRTVIYCGAHDSNAALHAARGLHEIANKEATVVSTGTWFVAMRLPATNVPFDVASLPESRDCLVNVDVMGGPVPSARFMGGRELDLLGGLNAVDGAAALQALPTLLTTQSMVQPSWIHGVGPFPNASATWINEPTDPAARTAAVALYAALMVDASLELIRTRARVLIEGRFAGAEAFVRAFATLRRDLKVFAQGHAYSGVTCGALRLVQPDLVPPSSLKCVEPLDIDLSGYKQRWLDMALSRECAQ